MLFSWNTVVVVVLVVLLLIIIIHTLRQNEDQLVALDQLTEEWAEQQTQNDSDSDELAPSISRRKSGQSNRQKTTTRTWMS